MRMLLESPWRGMGADALVILGLGLATALSVNIAAMGPPKWLFFVMVLLVGVSVLLIMPHRSRGSALYFFLFLSFSIAVNCHPKFIPPTVFRPINGVVVNLCDIPFYLLFVLWISRLVFIPEIRVHFQPLVTTLFWTLWVLTAWGLSRSQTPQAIKLPRFCWPTCPNSPRFAD